MIIVSDTTSISELAKVNYLYLLPELFGKLMIPQGVFNELLVGDHPAAQQVQDLSWLQVVTVNNQRLVEELQESFHLDLGESEAIALAEETKADQLLIDERAARRVALERKLPLIGTMGVLVLAKRQSLIPNVKDVLEQMQNRGTRIADHLYEQVLILAQEI
ncbi:MULTISPECIES: DUF3368 domain-containing protein [unclassified Roseofilum]|uniref:DUF3368 domain-containing protein n=1 Tax=unclassified Roseofilum TaxID=2620099 RepID=UPI000E89B89D|nr:MULTISPECIES: DUF3368 domain-containing protein [unclassified Roseofilum]MBP0008460.1 DUF3368 domain-containing protein [Roseofilum sp. Belize Diploria]MBP0033235.1 DUF3368 domain-containing protein [Roseofilum sp. Belize BBD 4]HBR00806.1 DUF3368 domain-containing protein [Cyanobacteria bacterium UBA11691]